MKDEPMPGIKYLHYSYMTKNLYPKYVMSPYKLTTDNLNNAYVKKLKYIFFTLHTH